MHGVSRHGAAYSDLVAALCCHVWELVYCAAMYRLRPFRRATTWFLPGLHKAKKILSTRIQYYYVEDTWSEYGDIHSCTSTENNAVNGIGVESAQYGCTNDANVTLLVLDESGHIPFLTTFEISP